MDNFNFKKYLKEGKLLKEENSIDDDSKSLNFLNKITDKYGLDVVQYWITSGEYPNEGIENDDYEDSSSLLSQLNNNKKEIDFLNHIIDKHGQRNLNNWIVGDDWDWEDYDD